MIALAPHSQDRVTEDMRTHFLDMLPAIRQQAEIAFRNLPQEPREELVAETIANAYVAFVGLCQQGREDVAYPTPLAAYAVKQVRAGRRVGAKLNSRDVTSAWCQGRSGLSVKRLDHYDREECAWKEVVVEDRRTTPAEVAATRIDVSAWLGTLPERLRQIACALATGERTCNVARKFGLTSARVSQIRSELRSAWEAFQGEPSFA